MVVIFQVKSQTFADTGGGTWLNSSESDFFSSLVRQKKIARGREQQTTLKRRFVGRDAPLLHCG